MLDPRIPVALSVVLAGTLSVGVAQAQQPAEVVGVRFVDGTNLSWSAVSGADAYNVYRGALLPGPAVGAARCHGFEIVDTQFSTPPDPEVASSYFYLVTAESSVGGEGQAGNGSGGAPRELLGSCRAVMRNHVLDRAGYGWDEWTRDRIATLGMEAYIDEQLDPASIDESGNTELQSRLGGIDPPLDIVQLVQQQVVRASYARRQLEQQVASFWANHFNTDWLKIADLMQGAFPQCQSAGNPPQCDPNFPARAYEVTTTFQYKEISAFRDFGFDGTFRNMVETSALSPAMIFFLDTYTSVAGSPNENFPRELLELYMMGVDGGYTQQDVEELARVFTGFNVCKKATADVDDLTGPCLSNYWEETPEGDIVATFVPSQHDCDPKTLFAGTPYEATISSTCANPTLGWRDLRAAVNVILDHPSTARFISRKILERFVTESPDEEMIDVLVDVWTDPSNPGGKGSMGAVLSAALHLDAFLDPDGIKTKIKTPLEHYVSAIRTSRGRTDGSVQVISSLVAAQHIPHYNPVPTGWPEDGASWIDTTNMLERQNFGIALLESTGFPFGSDPITLLQDNGVSTAPGNAEEIVQFFADALFGGALTQAERQAAIDYLNTDDQGVVSPYDDTRIREAVALMLGFPHFQEQ